MNCTLGNIHEEIAFTGDYLAESGMPGCETLQPHQIKQIGRKLHILAEAVEYLEGELLDKIGYTHPRHRPKQQRRKGKAINVTLREIGAKWQGD